MGQIRCVHHVEHANLPFGADAKRILGDFGVGKSCRWIGDAASYEEHLKSCPVEQHILSPPPAQAPAVVELVSANVEPQEEALEEEQVRVVRHDFYPDQQSEQTQLVLKSEELVKIFEYTDTGWA